jgi:YebC/PmpR family DNA-binding regulatory protein
MAGHSKWANIRHKKAANDKKRAKTWTKVIREITVAAREGATSNPDDNPRLRLAIDKALSTNMPKDTIERAAKRGAGELEGVNVEEILYEGYGPGGIAIMVDCMTDNRNRTVSEVRHAFSKAGGNLGTDGSVAYMFKTLGVFPFPEGTDEEALMDVALDAGADDVVAEDDGSFEVLCTQADFVTVDAALTKAGFSTDEGEVTLRADLLTTLGATEAAKLLRLVDALEELDDVQEVYSNADIPDAVMEAMAEE